jgi:hypothetical protein
MSQKIALCFIISYEHVLYKESIWREWIEPNKDIINVYFFYKDLKSIRSKWIYNHTIPPKYICYTSYYHVVPAYLNILNFALMNDKKNKWFCYLTESCCPIISPQQFRNLFEENCNKSIVKYSRPHWNIEFHRRANLALIPKEYHLANDPWFILTREHAVDCMNFALNEHALCNLICQGGLANESLFAIILKYNKKIIDVISETTHLADWARMSSPTSPHMFKVGNETDVAFIEKNLLNNKYAMFIRKVHPEFPDEILRRYLFQKVAGNYNSNTNFSHYIVEISNFLMFLFGIFFGGLFILNIWYKLTSKYYF